MVWPLAAAVWSGVEPPLFTLFTAARAHSSTEINQRTQCAWPPAEAQCSAVCPALETPGARAAQRAGGSTEPACSSFRLNRSPDLAAASQAADGESDESAILSRKKKLSYQQETKESM